MTFPCGMMDMDMEMVDMDHLAELSKTFGLVEERLPQMMVEVFPCNLSIC